MSSITSPTVVKVFISYAKSDFKVVERIIKKALTFRQFSFRGQKYKPIIWWDDDLEPAHGWKDQIKNHIRDADVVVFMMSKNFMASEFIQKTEVPLAMERYSPEEGITLFGLLVDACQYENSQLKKIQLFPSKNGRLRSFKNWRPKEEAYKYMRNALKIAIIKSISNLPGPMQNIPEDISRQDEKLYREQFLSYKTDRLVKYSTYESRQHQQKVASQKKKKKRRSLSKREKAFVFAILIFIFIISALQVVNKLMQ